MIVHDMEYERRFCYNATCLLLLKHHLNDLTMNYPLQTTKSLRERYAILHCKVCSCSTRLKAIDYILTLTKTNRCCFIKQLAFIRRQTRKEGQIMPNFTQRFYEKRSV